jgi:putative nucleotidyltransferase with HDIG domain
MIVVGVTSILFQITYNKQLNFLSTHNIISLLVCGIAYFLTETMILFGLLAQLNSETFFYYWTKNIRATKLEFLTLFPLGYLLIYLYIKNFWVAILLVPLFVAIYYASKEKIDVIKQTEKTLYTLAEIEDDKFPDTKKHSDRVGNLTEEMCCRLNIPEDQKEIIVKAARLHDIGKIAIPDWILEKPAKLTKEELEIVRKHPVKGMEIVKKLSAFKDGPEIILHHHERWDGAGYPDGLKGEDIPFGSRIITVVDSFDAMISDRPYKEAKTIKEALEDIKSNKGKQFDPQIADSFCKLIDELLEKPDLDFYKYFPENAKIE